MRRSVVLAAWLAVVWVALWQDLSIANLSTGLLVAVVLVVLFPLGGRARAAGHDPGRITVRLLPTARFAVIFAWKLLEASAIVTWQVLRPARTLDEAVVEVPLRTASTGIATIVADAVTLTPGTLTIEIASGGGTPVVLFVHVLKLRDPELIRADVSKFEDLALAAFGSPVEHEAQTRGQDG